MSDKDLLWVEVSDKTVTLNDGPTMPEPSNGYAFYMFGGRASMSRREFARWSGVTFPAPGIYAVRVKLGVVRRYRKVTSEEFVAAKHRTSRLEEVK